MNLNINWTISLNVSALPAKVALKMQKLFNPYCKLCRYKRNPRSLQSYSQERKAALNEKSCFMFYFKY